MRRAASGSLAFSAYAVAADDGSTVLVLVNKDRTLAAQVTTTLATSATTATLTRLTGPSLDSPAGALLNGAPIGADGTWAGQTPEKISVQGHTLTLSLAPASAVLARIR